MKLLALVTDAFGAPGGIARYNRDFLTALATQPSIDSVKVLPRNGTSEEPPPAPVEQLGPVPKKWLYAAQAVRLALTQRPDLIFCGHLNLLPLAWPISKLLRVPLWLQLHGIDAWERPNSIIAKMAEKANLVTCVSRYTRRRFLSWANIPPARVKVLPNTVSASASATVDWPSSISPMTPPSRCHRQMVES